MTPTLDYRTPQPKATAPWLTTIMLIAGCGALLLGVPLAIFAQSSLRKSQTNPNYSWGPRAYIFNMLESFVYFALVLIPVGTVLVLIGWRRLRTRRRAGT
jgi:hypothetical protein